MSTSMTFTSKETSAQWPFWTWSLPLSGYITGVTDCPTCAFNITKSLHYTGLHRHLDCYRQLLKSVRAKEKKLFQTAWEVEEYWRLHQQCSIRVKVAQKIIQDIETEGTPSSQQSHLEVKRLKKHLPQLVKNEKKQQLAATHSLFFLIRFGISLANMVKNCNCHCLWCYWFSDERRAKEPYAIPVQYLTYQSLKDEQIRNMADQIKAEMTTLGMEVAGMMFLN